MNLLLAQRDRHPKYLPPAGPVHAGGDQHRRVTDLAILPDLFVARIQVQIRDLAERAAAPVLQDGVELRGGTAHLA